RRICHWFCHYLPPFACPVNKPSRPPSRKSLSQFRCFFCWVLSALVDEKSLLSVGISSDVDVEVGVGGARGVVGAGGAAGLGQFGGHPAGALATLTEAESVAVPPGPLHDM